MGKFNEVKGYFLVYYHDQETREQIINLLKKIKTCWKEVIEHRGPTAT